MTATKRRVYEEIRTIVENEGGEMCHQRRGHPPGGAWVVQLHGKRTVFEADGREYMALARMYVPLRAHTTHARHYSHNLIDDAKAEWLNALRQDGSGARG
ncbi:MAG: hypothetical protein ACKVS8_03640 [Phycisphaerales bacterium]